MTSIDASSPPLNESLDYDDDDRLDARGVGNVLADRRSDTRVRGAKHRRHGSAAADLQFSNQVADSDLPAEEDQQ